ncbi:MAG: hypothetical protein CFH32_00998 [Alphaproteobacteria bacterium MarineAlpha9_Bin2]|nr:MAG: hypothetical protein CFH32_00998 [Alphaproteobacteria bacterium MarineAlpha9_Bin2]
MISILNFLKIMTFISLLLVHISGCAGLLVGGAATIGVASIQERSLKDAATDIEIRLRIEDQLFRADTTNLFSQVGVTVIEQRVLLVGSVSSEILRDRAAEITWRIPKVKEVLNELTVNPNSSLIDSAKDARISIILTGLLLTDTEILDINFSHSVSDQVVYIVGIAQDKEEVKKVIHHARTIRGVKKVISHILLKSDKRRT